jgi:hypothetical protein
VHLLLASPLSTHLRSFAVDREWECTVDLNSPLRVQLSRASDDPIVALTAALQILLGVISQPGITQSSGIINQISVVAFDPATQRVAFRVSCNHSTNIDRVCSRVCQILAVDPSPGRLLQAELLRVQTIRAHPSSGQDLEAAIRTKDCTSPPFVFQAPYLAHAPSS